MATDKNSKYNKRRWSVPSKRAKGYADERRSKVHQRKISLSLKVPFHNVEKSVGEAVKGRAKDFRWDI